MSDLEKRNADLESRLAASRELSKNLSSINARLLDDVVSMKTNYNKQVSLTDKAYWDGYYAKEKNISTQQNAIHQILITSIIPLEIIRQIREISRFPVSIRLKPINYSFMLNNSHEAWMVSFAFLASSDLNKITSSIESIE